VDGVVAAVVPPVPDRLVDALIAWHTKMTEVAHQSFPLIAGRLDVPLTQYETLGQQLKQLDSLGAVVRAEMIKAYREVQAAYRDASAAAV
jgi:hypothetical protein